MLLSLGEFQKYRKAIQHAQLKEDAMPPEMLLNTERQWSVYYTPFEWINPDAKLVIVGITPGPTQANRAYETARSELSKGKADEAVLRTVKQQAAFSGLLRKNLVRMLDELHIPELIGAPDGDSLWGSHAHLLYSTSLLKHATFKSGKPFNGPFGSVVVSPMLKQLMEQHFAAHLRELVSPLILSLGPVAAEGVSWCVQRGLIHGANVLGSLPHPSAAAGNQIDVFLRKVSPEQLNPANPVAKRASALLKMRAELDEKLALLGLKQAQQLPRSLPLKKAAAAHTPIKTKEKKPTKVAELRVDPSDPLAPIWEVIEAEGMEFSHDRARRREYVWPNTAKYLYVTKDSGNINHITLSIHPDHEPRSYGGLQDVPQESFRITHGSGMRHFPKKVQHGEKPINYGWTLTVASLEGLKRFLRTHRSVGLT